MKINEKIITTIIMVFLLIHPCFSQDIIKMVQEGKLDIVTQLLKENPKLVSSKDSAGRQPIHFAASKGNAEMVTLLLTNGADPGAKTLANTTVLHFAANGGHSAVVKLLLETGISLDEKNNQQVTPLYFAAMRGHLDVVSLLYDLGADPDALDAEKGTPIQAAALAGHFEMVKLLAEKGADAGHLDINGRTALHFACQAKNLEIVNFLIKVGLDVKLQDKFGKSGLHYALEQGNVDLVRKFLKDWPKLMHLKAKDGSSVLHAAILGGEKELVELVLEQGTEIDSKDNYGLTPLDYANQRADPTIVSFLTGKGVKKDPTAEKNLKSKYPDTNFPGVEPVLFAPGIISTPFNNERDLCISKDFKELYFTRWLAGEWDIQIMTKNNQVWFLPSAASFNSPWLEAEAFFTPDEQRIFFISNRPESGEGSGGPWEIWVVKRFGTKWGQAQMLGEDFKTGFYTTFTAEGKMFLTLNNKMQYALPDKDGFRKPQVLPASVNGEHGGYNGFVAPDESFLIFSTTIEGEGYGEGDLYITFKKPDGTWTKVKNMGPGVNSFARDYCPSVSPDGKYFFFSSRRFGNEDIFWMDADVIKKLEKVF